MNGNILIIEPDYPNFLVLRKFLTLIGYLKTEILNINMEDLVASDVSKTILIFVNISLFENDPEFFLKFTETYKDVPVIALATNDSETTALRAVKSGAQDYLIKDEITLGLFQKTVWNAIERTNRLKNLRNITGKENLIVSYPACK